MITFTQNFNHNLQLNSPGHSNNNNGFPNPNTTTNTFTTNYTSSSNGYNSSTPIYNESDSSLFNFGYGNLLKNIDEVENENSVSMSPKNIENKIRVNTTKHQLGSSQNKMHKYSPSYVMNDMSEIMKHLNIPIHNKEALEENDEYEGDIIVLNGDVNYNSYGNSSGQKTNLSKFSKNQFSVPEFNNKKKVDIMIESPDKLSMDESNKNNY